MALTAAPVGHDQQVNMGSATVAATGIHIASTTNFRCYLGGSRRGTCK